MLFSFLARTKTEKIALSKEHKGYLWLSYEEAVEKVTYLNAKELLRKAHAFLEH